MEQTGNNEDTKINKSSSTITKNQVQIIKNVKASSNSNYDYIFKMALIGDSDTGKSSILTRFTDNYFQEDTSSTIGVDFKIVSMKIGNNIKAKMQIWDTCGSERFKSLTASFIKSCPAFLLVFDITKYKSLKNLDNWINIIKTNTNPRLLCLVGNKSDMGDKRKVSFEEAVEYAEKNNVKYIECSAKENKNVDEIFINVARTLYGEIVGGKMEGDKSYRSDRCDRSAFGLGDGSRIIDRNNENENNKDSDKLTSFKKKCCLS